MVEMWTRVSCWASVISCFGRLAQDVIWFNHHTHHPLFQSPFAFRRSRHWSCACQSIFVLPLQIKKACQPFCYSVCLMAARQLQQVVVAVAAKEQKRGQSWSHTHTLSLATLSVWQCECVCIAAVALAVVTTTTTTTNAAFAADYVKAVDRQRAQSYANWSHRRHQGEKESGRM